MNYPATISKLNGSTANPLSVVIVYGTPAYLNFSTGALNHAYNCTHLHVLIETGSPTEE